MIKRLIKMHIQLIRYVVKEIFKKKKIKEHLKFFKAIGIQYLKVMLQEFKNTLRIFDTDFRQAKKKQERIQKLKVDLKRALKMLKHIDRNLTKMGKNRQYCRQFWRDFFKSGQIRNEIFNDLEKELK